MYLNFDIIFSTADAVCGREITQHLGILAERSIISANTENADMAAAMDIQYAALADAMNRRAKDIGADAVVGVDFRLDAAGDKLIFSMMGNAVRLKSIENTPEPAETLPAEEPAAEEIEILPAEEAAIEAIESFPEQAPAIEEIEIIPAEVEIPLEEAAGPEWTCRNCGTNNEDQFRYCPKCGEIRSFDWLCPSCGQKNLSEYKFCPGCGSVRG